MKAFKKPNLKGPRFKRGRVSLLKESSFKEFKQLFPKYKDLTISQFREIVKTFNKHLVDAAIQNRDGIALPENLGFIFLGSCPAPTKRKNIDYATSIKLGKSVRHTNWESNQRLLKIYYTNSSVKYRFKNRNMWSFHAVRQFKRKASAAFSKNWNYYFEILPTVKIADLYEKRRKKAHVAKYATQVPDNYNEFNL